LASVAEISVAAGTGSIIELASIQVRLGNGVRAAADDRCTRRQTTGRAGRYTIEAIQGWAIADRHIVQGQVATVSGCERESDNLADMVKTWPG